AVVASACSLPGSNGGDLDSGVVVTPASSQDEGDGSTQATMADQEASPWVDASTRAIVSNGPLPVFEAPDGGPILTLNPTTDFGTTRVLLVEDERDGWLKVRLPMRPNHQSGWIPASSVETEELDIKVYVDLADRELTVVQGDDIVIQTPVAIGTAENPTPTGTFSITDKLATPDASGGYGPFALGLSGYSETLTEFAGGDGQVGIHGTNDPASIGQAASHGCIRVPNEIVEQLADLLPLGTPVHVV
ncbi:MAG: L,D-transpeptidase family protein, partial [Actinomycetota bacterium]